MRDDAAEGAAATVVAEKKPIRHADSILGELGLAPDTQLATLPADSYELIEEVARGGMGRVVRAIDKRLGRVVALKLLLGDSPHLRARFAREAQITAGLQHPSIVPIYEAGRWPDGSLAYAMKLVSGVPLDQAIDRSGSLADRLPLLPRFTDVVDAVAYAHSKRVVHRDIKPSNIILGEFGETILIDWGVAKSLDVDDPSDDQGQPVDSQSERLTALGAVIGTPVYMPPEQAAGKTIDERADVYALGAVLYHLLSGRLPYTAASPAEVLREVVVGPPASLESVESHAPRELAAVVARAMDREAARRYSAAELAAELRRFTTGKLVGAYRYSARERFVRWLKRHRAAVSVGAAALAVLIAVATISARRIVRERDRARDLVADQYAEQGRVLLLAGDPARALAYLLAAADAGERGPALDLLLTRAAHAVEQRRHNLVGHRGPVGFVTFDATGDRVVTTGDDGTARIWDAGTGAALHVLTGHAGDVRGAEFAPQGDQLLTFGADGTVRLWNPADGRSLRSLTGGPGIVSARYGASGEEIVAAAHDGSVRVFDRATGATRSSFSAGATSIRDARFDAAGAIWTAGDHGEVAVWSREGVPLRRWPLDRGVVMGLAQDGERTAAILASGAVAVWEGRAEPRLLDLGEPVINVLRSNRLLPLFSGDRLFVPCNSAVQVFDLVSGRRLFTLSGHAGEVSWVALSPDRSRIATASGDGTARLWRAADGGLLSILQTIDHTRMVAFAPRGDLVATASYTGAALWAPVPDPPRRQLVGHQGPIYSVRFRPDGARVVSAGADRTVRVWDVASGAEVAIAREEKAVFHAAWDPAGRRIATAGEDGIAVLRDAETLETIARIDGHGGVSLMAVDFSPDGTMLATASDDRTVKLWAVDGTRLLRTLRHRGAVNAVAFDPGGVRVVTATQDGTAQIWDATSGERLHVVALEGPGLSAAFSPDGDRVVVTARRAALIVDAASGELIGSLIGHQREVSAARLGKDGLAVTSSYDGGVKVWDAMTGRVLVALEGHQGAWVSWADIEAAGRRIASSDQAGGLVVWDISRERRTPAQLAAQLEAELPFMVKRGLLMPRSLH